MISTVFLSSCSKARRLLIRKLTTCCFSMSEETKVHGQSVTIKKTKENTSLVVRPLKPIFVNLTVTNGRKSDGLYGCLRASRRRWRRENGRKPPSPQESLPSRASTQATISFYNNKSKAPSDCFPMSECSPISA